MAETSRDVLITGCSSGIGRATALRLAGAGWPVWATARREASIADLKEHGCRVLSLDVTDEGSMQAAVDTVTEAAGAVGVLVNNAGYSQSGAVEDLSMDALRRQFDTNVFGLVRLTQLCLPGMRAQGSGKVVNISSMGGTLTFPGGGAYHASKYAVEALSDALRFELRGFGVDVIVIQPGLIRTGFSDAAVDAMEDLDEATGPYGAFNLAVADATKRAYVDSPMARFSGTADDVADVILNAIAAPRPRARYPVTMSARLLMWQRRISPDWLWDRVMAGSFVAPGQRD